MLVTHLEIGVESVATESAVPEECQAGEGAQEAGRHDDGGHVQVADLLGQFQPMLTHSEGLPSTEP